MMPHSGMHLDKVDKLLNFAAFVASESRNPVSFYDWNEKIPAASFSETTFERERLSQTGWLVAVLWVPAIDQLPSPLGSSHPDGQVSSG